MRFELLGLFSAANLLVFVSRGSEVPTNREKRETKETEKEKLHPHSWNYEELGPSVWPKYYANCAGRKQSPVNIQLDGDIQSEDMGEIFFGNYDVELTNLTIRNNGHSVQIDISDDDSTPYIMNGGLETKYSLIQFHFHWALKNSEGSETTVDGRQYPLELHLVHKKEGVSPSELATTANSLAVLAVLFDVKDGSQSVQNSILNTLGYEVTDVIKELQTAGSTSYVNSTTMKNLLPRDHSTFFRYSGSLTTPPCSETVVWTVFAERILVSEEQLEIFRQVQGSSGEILEKNYRPVQNLNGRKIIFRTNTFHLPSSTSTSALTVVLVILICILVLVILFLVFLLAKAKMKRRIVEDAACESDGRENAYAVRYQAKSQ